MKAAGGLGSYLARVRVFGSIPENLRAVKAEPTDQRQHGGRNPTAEAGKAGQVAAPSLPTIEFSGRAVGGQSFGFSIQMEGAQGCGSSYRTGEPY